MSQVVSLKKAAALGTSFRKELSVKFVVEPLEEKVDEDDPDMIMREADRSTKTTVLKLNTEVAALSRAISAVEMRLNVKVGDVSHRGETIDSDDKFLAVLRNHASSAKARKKERMSALWGRIRRAVGAEEQDNVAAGLAKAWELVMHNHTYKTFTTHMVATVLHLMGNPSVTLPIRARSGGVLANVAWHEDSLIKVANKKARFFERVIKAVFAADAMLTESDDGSRLDLFDLSGKAHIHVEHLGKGPVRRPPPAVKASFGADAKSGSSKNLSVGGTGSGGGTGGAKQRPRLVPPHRRQEFEEKPREYTLKLLEMAGMVVACLMRNEGGVALTLLTRHSFEALASLCGAAVDLHRPGVRARARTVKGVRDEPLDRYGRDLYTDAAAAEGIVHIDGQRDRTLSELSEASRGTSVNSSAPASKPGSRPTSRPGSRPHDGVTATGGAVAVAAHGSASKPARIGLEGVLSDEEIANRLQLKIVDSMAQGGPKRALPPTVSPQGRSHALVALVHLFAYTGKAGVASDATPAERAAPGEGLSGTTSDVSSGRVSALASGQVTPVELRARRRDDRTASRAASARVRGASSNFGRSIRASRRESGLSSLHGVHDDAPRVADTAVEASDSASEASGSADEAGDQARPLVSLGGGSGASRLGSSASASSGSGIGAPLTPVRHVNTRRRSSHGFRSPKAGASPGSAARSPKAAQTPLAARSSTSERTPTARPAVGSGMSVASSTGGSRRSSIGSVAAIPDVFVDMKEELLRRRVAEAGGIAEMLGRAAVSGTAVDRHMIGTILRHLTSSATRASEAVRRKAQQDLREADQLRGGSAGAELEDILVGVHVGGVGVLPAPAPARASRPLAVATNMQPSQEAALKSALQRSMSTLGPTGGGEAAGYGAKENDDVVFVDSTVLAEFGVVTLIARLWVAAGGEVAYTNPHGAEPRADIKRSKAKNKKDKAPAMSAAALKAAFDKAEADEVARKAQRERAKERAAREAAGEDVSGSASGSSAAGPVDEVSHDASGAVASSLPGSGSSTSSSDEDDRSSAEDQQLPEDKDWDVGFDGQRKRGAMPVHDAARFARHLAGALWSCSAAATATAVSATQVAEGIPVIGIDGDLVSDDGAGPTELHPHDEIVDEALPVIGVMCSARDPLVSSAALGALACACSSDERCGEMIGCGIPTRVANVLGRPGLAQAVETERPSYVRQRESAHSLFCAMVYAAGDAEMAELLRSDAAGAIMEGIEPLVQQFATGIKAHRAKGRRRSLMFGGFGSPSIKKGATLHDAKVAEHAAHRHHHHHHHHLHPGHGHHHHPGHRDAHSHGPHSQAAGSAVAASPPPPPPPGPGVTAGSVAATMGATVSGDSGTEPAESPPPQPSNTLATGMSRQARLDAPTVGWELLRHHEEHSSTWRTLRFATAAAQGLVCKRPEPQDGRVSDHGAHTERDGVDSERTSPGGDDTGDHTPARSGSPLSAFGGNDHLATEDESPEAGNLAGFASPARRRPDATPFVLGASAGPRLLHALRPSVVASLLQMPDPRVFAYTCLIIWKQASDVAVAGALAREGAIVRLLEWCEVLAQGKPAMLNARYNKEPDDGVHAVDESDDEEMGSKDLVFGLQRLDSAVLKLDPVKDKTLQAMIANGVVNPVQLQIIVVATIAKLLFNPDAARIFLNSEGVELFHALLKVPSRAYRTVQTIVTTALWTFVTQGDECVDRMVELEASGTLATLAMDVSRSAQLRVAASGQVRSMVENPVHGAEVERQLEHAGTGIAPLLLSVVSADDKRCQEMAAAAIAAACKTAAFKKTVAERKGTNVLVDLLRATDEPVVAQNALHALLNLTTESENQANVGRYGLQTVFDIALTPAYPTLQSFAQKIIMNLKQHPTNRTGLYRLQLSKKAQEFKAAKAAERKRQRAARRANRHEAGARAAEPAAAAAQSRSRSPRLHGFDDGTDDDGDSTDSEAQYQAPSTVRETTHKDEFLTWMRSIGANVRHAREKYEVPEEVTKLTKRAMGKAVRRNARNGLLMPPEDDDGNYWKNLLSDVKTPINWRSRRATAASGGPRSGVVKFAMDDDIAGARPGRFTSSPSSVLKAVREEQAKEARRRVKGLLTDPEPRSMKSPTVPALAHEMRGNVTSLWSPNKMERRRKRERVRAEKRAKHEAETADSLYAADVADSINLTLTHAEKVARRKARRRARRMLQRAMRRVAAERARHRVARRSLGVINEATVAGFFLTQMGTGTAPTTPGPAQQRAQKAATRHPPKSPLTDPATKSPTDKRGAPALASWEPEIMQYVDANGDVIASDGFTATTAPLEADSPGGGAESGSDAPHASPTKGMADAQKAGSPQPPALAQVSSSGVLRTLFGQTDGAAHSAEVAEGKVEGTKNAPGFVSPGMRLFRNVSVRAVGHGVGTVMFDGDDMVDDASPKFTSLLKQLKRKQGRSRARRAKTKQISDEQILQAYVDSKARLEMTVVLAPTDRHRVTFDRADVDDRTKAAAQRKAAEDEAEARRKAAEALIAPEDAKPKAAHALKLAKSAANLFQSPTSGGVLGMFGKSGNTGDAQSADKVHITAASVPPNFVSPNFVSKSKATLSGITGPSAAASVVVKSRLASIMQGAPGVPKEKGGPGSSMTMGGSKGQGRSTVFGSAAGASTAFDGTGKPELSPRAGLTTAVLRETRDTQLRRAVQYSPRGTRNVEVPLPSSLQQLVDESNKPPVRRPSRELLDEAVKDLKCPSSRATVHVCKFEHVEGSTVCQSLYKHYTLPDGRTVHFHLHDELEEIVTEGVARPPEPAFSLEDALIQQLPRPPTSVWPTIDDLEEPTLPEIPHPPAQDEHAGDLPCAAHGKPGCKCATEGLPLSKAPDELVFRATQLPPDRPEDIVPFVLEESIFKPRMMLSGRGYYDGTKGIAVASRMDWNRIVTLRGFMTTMRSECGADDNAIRALRRVFVANFKVLWDLFAYYACLSRPGDGSEVRLNGWLLCLEDCNIIDERSSRCNRNALSKLMTATNLKEKEPIGNNELRHLMRYEFITFLVLASQAKFFARGGATQSISTAFEKLVNECIVPNIPHLATFDHDDFRRAHLYDKSVAWLYETNLEVVQALWTRVADVHVGKLRCVSMDSFISLLVKYGIIHEHFEREDARLVFTISLPRLADDTKNKSTSTCLGFVDFLEALGRVAMHTGMPTKGDLMRARVRTVPEYFDHFIKIGRSPYRRSSATIEGKAIRDGGEPDADATFPTKPRPLAVKLRGLLQVLSGGQRIFKGMPPGYRDDLAQRAVTPERQASTFAVANSVSKGARKLLGASKRRLVGKKSSSSINSRGSSAGSTRSTGSKPPGSASSSASGGAGSGGVGGRTPSGVALKGISEGAS